jgi:hypothetical protein
VACTVFVGDVTPVGKSPDKPGNEAIKLSQPLINSNGEYGFALKKLGDSAVIGVLNENFGSPEDVPFDIIHKRWRSGIASSKEQRRQGYARSIIARLFVPLQLPLSPIFAIGVGSRPLRCGGSLAASRYGRATPNG